MPLYKTIQVNKSTKVLIWKIEESLDDLSKGILLQEAHQNRVNSMKSEIHKRGFMSVRHLLKTAGYNDHDLTYDHLGKPHLNGDKHISISHSYNFSSIILSHDLFVGIDIEKQRDKIVKIANKFTPLEEYKTLANHDALVRKLTIVWGAKESLYKIYEQEGLSFISHIDIPDFYFDDAKTTGTIDYKGTISDYAIHFLEFEGFTCVYALKK